MSLTKTKREQTKYSTVDEVIAREVAALDRYVLKTAKEMSRPKPALKVPKKPK